MKYILYLLLITLPIEALALDFSSLFSKSEEKKQTAPTNDPKGEAYFNACRKSSLTTLLNIVKDAKAKHKELDNFSVDKCTRLKSLTDSMNMWDEVKDPKFEGCTKGVDAAIGMSSADDELRRKFKIELCL